MKFSPTTPVGWVWLRLRNRINHARANPERGASAIEWVIITAALVALAGAIGLVIYNLVNDKAESIEIPDDPGSGGGGGGGGA